MRRNPLPSPAYLRELFDYDPRTGILSWRVERAQMKVGMPAGARRGDSGYLQVSIDRKLYRVHLVIWVWMMGSEPPAQLDHRDLNKSNNRWDNLRLATKSQNSANTPLSARNTSGYKGVFWYRAYGKWAAQVWKDGVSYFLGYFEHAENASAAYQAKARELYGEFARAA